MKNVVAVFAAILFMLPNVIVANPMAQRAAATLTNRVMGMLEPQIAELADKAPVPPDVKDELRRQLTEAARRIVEQEIQGAMGGRLPNANAVVNKVGGELVTIAENIVAGILDGSISIAGGGGAATAPQEKPRLRIEPFQIGDGNDSETIIALLSTQGAMLNAFSIVSNEDETDYVLVTEVHTLGESNILMMRIINVNDNSQIASENLTYQRIEEVAENLPQLAGQLAASAPRPVIVEQVMQVSIPTETSTHTANDGGSRVWKSHQIYLGGSLGVGVWEEESWSYSGGYFHVRDGVSFALAFVADFPLLAPVVSFETGIILGNPMIGVPFIGRGGFISETFEITYDLGYILGNMCMVTGGTIGFRARSGMLFLRYQFKDNNGENPWAHTFSIGYKTSVGRTRAERRESVSERQSYEQ